MTANEKIVFTNESQVHQFLGDFPDSVIFEGITIEMAGYVPYPYEAFWERYAEQERSVDVPSFRKWFDEAGLELDFSLGLRWTYTDRSGFVRWAYTPRSGLYSHTFDKSRALEFVESVSKFMVSDDYKSHSGGELEPIPVSCRFYFPTFNLEKHEEAA
jgi:hypothetical protein